MTIEVLAWGGDGEVWFWCLMPLSTIFQLYRGSQFWLLEKNKHVEGLDWIKGSQFSPLDNWILNGNTETFG